MPQGRWQHGEKVGYCYPSGPEKTLCKWDICVPLVTKGLSVPSIQYRFDAVDFQVRVLRRPTQLSAVHSFTKHSNQS
jgi:hypothetical protein